jgi:hypothetical protein
MCQWVPKANGRVVSRRTLRPLTVAELHSLAEIKRREIFDDLIGRTHGTSINPPTDNLDDDGTKDFEPYEDDDEDPIVTPEIEDVVDTICSLICQQPAYDKLINCKVMMQQEEMAKCQVKQSTIG